MAAPLQPIAFLFLILLALYAARFLYVFGQRRVIYPVVADVDHCVKCGYNLAGLGSRPTCPECGHEDARYTTTITRRWIFEPQRILMFLGCATAVPLIAALCAPIWKFLYRLDGWDTSILHPDFFQSASGSAVAEFGLACLVLYWHVYMPRLSISRARWAALAFAAATLLGVVAGLAWSWYVKETTYWSTSHLWTGLLTAYLVLAVGTWIFVDDAPVQTTPPPGPASRL